MQARYVREGDYFTFAFPGADLKMTGTGMPCVGLDDAVRSVGQFIQLRDALIHGLFYQIPVEPGYLQFVTVNGEVIIRNYEVDLRLDRNSFLPAVEMLIAQHQTTQ